MKKIALYLIIFLCNGYLEANNWCSPRQLTHKKSCAQKSMPNKSKKGNRLRCGGRIQPSSQVALVANEEIDLAWLMALMAHCIGSELVHAR